MREGEGDDGGEAERGAEDGEGAGMEPHRLEVGEVGNDGELGKALQVERSERVS